MTRKLMILFAAVAAAFGTLAETETVGGYTWTYQIYDGCATIENGYSCAVDPIPSGGITVPATLGGYPVTCIGDYAFYCCNNLTGVTLPDKLGEIGRYAFAWCNSLNRIDIPAGVTSIRYNAFYCCYDLVSVAIPDSVSFIGREAFNNCNEALYDTQTIGSLKLVDGWVVGFNGEVPVELDMKDIRGVADNALSGVAGVRNVTSLPQSVCSSGLYNVFPDSYMSITNVTIAEGVADIGSSAFYGCEGLRNVSMPDSVTNIGYHAFGSCTNLTSVAIPSRVENLRYTFEGCSNLKEVTLGASVSYVGTWCGDSAFSGCASLTKIDVATENQTFRFIGGLLLTHDGKEVVYVPEGRDYLFIPESVVKIPWDAFSRCRKLARTIDKYGIESIDGWVIECDFDKLPKQLVLDGYRGIADDVFYGCEKLVSVVFGEAVTAIGNDSFSWCINLNSISVSASVRKIDPEAFRCCFGLKNISVAKDNPTYKFENNLLLSKDDSELIAVSRNATSATIPEGVRYIPNGFFSGCMSLTDVKIPATVVDMFDGTPFSVVDDDGHYWGCPALKSITVADGNPVYKSGNGLLLANYDDQGLNIVAVPQALTNITVPEGVEWIAYFAFVGCDKLSSLHLPSSISDYDFEVFSAMPNLTSISIADDNPWFSSANGLLLSKDGTEIRAVPPGVTNVTLPASVVDLGDGFYGCNKLKSIAVESGNERFSSINGMLVNSDGELVEVPRGLAGQTSIKIPVGVKRVGSWTFSDFGKLTSIDIPEGVAEIERYAFVGCESLSSVKLPSTLTVIGERAFSGCPVKSISFPAGLEEIGPEAFTDLTRFDTTTVPGLRLIDGWMFGVSDTFEADYASPEDYLNDAINSSRIKGIAGGAFDRCNFLKKLVLPDCVKRIPYWMFGNCWQLERIELPNGLVSIGEGAFVNCDIGEVSIPVTVRHVGVDAFSDNVINKDVVQGLGIVDGWVVRSYGTKAIVGDDESFVGELTLSGKDGIRGIADNAFCDSHGGCASDEREFSGVSNLVIGAGIVSIGERAFACCYDLTNVYVSATVEFIGEYAFQGCDNLRTAFLPVMLKGKIPQSAFPAKTKLLYCRDDGVIEYTVRFDAHGGVGRMENQTLVKDTPAVLYGCTFTRTGYTFAGWAVSPTGGVVYGDGESVVNVYEQTGSGIVLYAVWKSLAAEMCEEVFGGVGVVSANDAWDTVVVITNDVSGTVEIPDNVGAVTIDLNGHDMVGDGGPAIRIVAGDGEGGATRLAIVDTSEGEKGQILGGGESAGIEVAEDAAPSVRFDVEEGVGVFNGDGSEQPWWELCPIEATLVAGKYFKATLVELGYDVPTDGTPYSVVAKGLPAGLKLVSNAAVKDKKGKVVIKAKSEWWIEGVPTTAVDFFTNPPYLVITANGETKTEALPVEVAAQDVIDLGELALGQSVNTNGWLAGVGAGWTVSGLPTGLKYTAKLLTTSKKVGKKTVVTTNALPYSVYGKTTKAGLFTITAKRKTGAFYETMKYRVLVKPAPVDTALFGEELTNITTMAYVPFEWDLTNDVAAVGGKVAKVAGLPAGLAFASATTYKDKKKTQVKQYGQTIVGTPTKPGTYVVTFTKNVKSGKTTVAKTAQILWTVTANDANLELGFNTAGGVIEGGTVGLKYGDLMAFSATDGATVTASGMPAGITLANLGDGSYAFRGFTTKAGTYLVTVKATLKGKTVAQRVALKVDALPAWAKGTFNGYIAGEDGATNGLAAVTVSSVGKISGKFYEGGTNWTFTAASYTGYDNAAPAYLVPVVATYSYKAKEKVKVNGKWTTKTVTKSVARNFTLRVGQDALGGVATLEEVDGSTVEAWQNLWGQADYKALGKQLFSTKSGKKTLAYRTFTIKGTDDVGAEMGLTDAMSLSLKVTTAGVVTATMSFDTGKTSSKGKAVIYKPTCSTVVIPLSAADNEEFEGEAILFFAPSSANNFPGFAGAAPL